MSETTKTPRTVRCDRVHTLGRDNVDTQDFWFMLDGDEVILCKQRRGEMPDNKFFIPRRTFNRFIDWYNTGEWPRRRRKSA